MSYIYVPNDLAHQDVAASRHATASTSSMDRPGIIYGLAGKSPASLTGKKPTGLKCVHTEAEWDNIRPIVTRLYSTERKPLKQVMRVLQEDYNFKATTQMYKKRIAKWDLYKRHRRHEVVCILRKRNANITRGESSAITLRGKEVSFSDIERYLRRLGKSEEELLDDWENRDVPTPQMLQNQRHSSVPHPLATPEEFESVEILFHRVNDYMLGSVEARICQPDSSSLTWRTDPPQAEQLAMEVYDYLWIGTQMSKAGAVSAAFLQYRQAFSSIQSLLKCRNISGAYHIAFAISDLLPLGQADLVASLLTYVSQMSLVVLGPQDPHTMIWKALKEIPLAAYTGLSAPLKQQRTSLFTKTTEASTPLGFCAHLWHAYAVLSSHPDLPLRGHFPDLAETEREFGPLSTQVMDLLYQQARVQYARGDHEGGEATCLLSIEKTERMDSWRHRSYLCHALRHMSRAQHKRKKYSQARVNYIRALEVQRASLKDVTPALTQSKVFQIYEELDWISNHSDVADGDQQWRERMNELQQEWEAELNPPG